MCTRIINLQNKLEVLDFNKEMLRNVVKASSIGNKDAEILHLEDRKAKFEIILKEHYFILKEISRDNAVKLLASIEAILAKESNDYSRFYQQSLKIIDKKGFEFADEVNRRSKALQENKKFSPEQTAALVTDWGNDNKVTKNIALFALKINLVFFSLWSLISLPCFPVSSHREHCNRGIIFASGRVIPFFAKRTGEARGR